jgi:hypothetical protein
VSGGRWGYRSEWIRDLAGDESTLIQLRKLLGALAETERIVDWAESGDTVRRRDDGSGAERDLYDLWVRTFNEVWPD